GSSFAVDKCCRFAGNIRRIRIHKISPSTYRLVFEGAFILFAKLIKRNIFYIIVKKLQDTSRILEFLLA
ncbi:hypothetical protein, partial [Ruminococcus sp.]